MQEMNIPKDTWVEVFTGVTEANFFLTNFPNITRKRAYKISYGTTTPAFDATEVVYHQMIDSNHVNVQFNNTAAQNVYVMAMYDDGKIVY